MEGEHQVCRARMVRKARDLAQSGALGKKKKEFAREIYFEIQGLFKEVKTMANSNLSNKKRSIKLPEFYERLDRITNKYRVVKSELKSWTILRI